MSRFFGAIEPVQPITLPSLTQSSIPQPGYYVETQADRDNLLNIINRVPVAVNQGITAYYDAATAVDQARLAHQAGVPVATYQALNTPKNALASVVGSNTPMPTILGIPLWVLLAGLGVVLVARR
jgi:hypothetical protein